jgi:Protein of unknown function (DUF2752)
MHAFVQSTSSRRILAVALALTIGGVGFWVLRSFPPTADSWYPKCVFYQATGLHCPGCGGTRALGALVRGDLLLAIRNNPMVILGIPTMLALVVHQQRRERTGRSAFPRLAWALFFLLVIFFIARNIPSPTTSPFAPPAPTFTSS